MPNSRQINQGGLSLVEVLIATVMASAIFILIIAITARIQKNYVWQESLSYRQSVLQNGWWELVQSLKKVHASFWYLYYTPTPYQQITTQQSINNNIVMQSSDFKGNPVLTAEVVTSARTGPSKVNVGSDQLVIQYTTDKTGTHDCEGGLILPFSSSQQSVVERSYVRTSADSADQLELVCDAGRYSATAGFSGMNTRGKVIVPNVDYFHVLPVVTTGTSNNMVYVGGVQPGPGTTQVWTSIDNYYLMPAPPTAFGRYISGVDIGVIFHSPIPAGINWTRAAKNTFAMMDINVTLNSGLNTSNAIYDFATNTVSLGRMDTE